MRARNVIGWGVYSADLLAALTGAPNTPSAPIKDLNLSTKTSIAIEWASVADNSGESGGLITGYRVYMAKDSDGSYVQLFDGKDFRTIVTFIADDLDTGRFYRFRISAFNFNGESEMSPEIETYACLAPSKMAAPVRVTSSLTEFTLSWEEP